MLVTITGWGISYPRNRIFPGYKVAMIGSFFLRIWVDLFLTCCNHVAIQTVATVLFLSEYQFDFGDLVQHNLADFFFSGQILVKQWDGKCYW